jgi:hypothetical protein
MTVSELVDTFEKNDQFAIVDRKTAQNEVHIKNIKISDTHN